MQCVVNVVPAHFGIRIGSQHYRQWQEVGSMCKVLTTFTHYNVYIYQQFTVANDAYVLIKPAGWSSVLSEERQGHTGCTTRIAASP
eukprot:COSAG02_NODE_2158_length_9635_cov_32.352139_3_plen_86_part_00